jgi:hypothetical protein
MYVLGLVNVWLAIISSLVKFFSVSSATILATTVSILDGTGCQLSKQSLPYMKASPHNVPNDVSDIHMCRRSCKKGYVSVARCIASLLNPTARRWSYYTPKLLPACKKPTATGRRPQSAAARQWLQISVAVAAAQMSPAACGHAVQLPPRHSLHWHLLL